MEEQNGVHTYTLGMNQFADMVGGLIIYLQ